MTIKNHIVMFSGGVGSYCAAKRVAEKYGTENLHLLFTDTLSEDEDLYRFIYQAAEKIGGKFHHLKEGRDIWQVFKDVKHMGSSRIDPCSRILKREFADKWMSENFNPDDCMVYTGIDWTEEHRHTRMSERKLPWTYKAPMVESPLLTKPEMIEIIKEDGIEPPKLYKMRFPHNNCGGFCVKAGQAQFKLLYEQMPEKYLEYEKNELEVYEEIGEKYPFLKISKNKISDTDVDKYSIKVICQISIKYQKTVGPFGIRYISFDRKYFALLTLMEFRKLFLMPKCTSQIDLFDFGGCGCFLDDEA